MTRVFGNLILISVLAAGLSACGGGGSGSSQPPQPPPTGTTPSPPPPSTGTVADRLGAAFAALFRAGPNTEPRDPAPGDIAAVNLTAEPIDF